jgi:hypothetical protein
MQASVAASRTGERGGGETVGEALSRGPRCAACLVTPHLGLRLFALPQGHDDLEDSPGPGSCREMGRQQEVLGRAEGARDWSLGFLSRCPRPRR